MLYQLFDFLHTKYDLAGAGLFQYISFRAGMAVVLSILISVTFGERLIKMLQKLFLNIGKNNKGFTYIEVLASTVFIIAAISILVTGIKVSKTTKKYSVELTNRNSLEKDICTIFSSYSNIEDAILEAKSESTRRGYLDTIITKSPHGVIENLHKITVEVNQIETSEVIAENKFIFWMRLVCENY